MFKLCCAVAVLGLLTLAGCSSASKAPAEVPVFRMGERAQAGSLIYTVLDTEWLDQIGDATNPRLPKNRFLAVRVSITNSGSANADIPPMTLESGKDSIAELNEAPGVNEWLGYIRSVKPADTLTGRVIFDAAPKKYTLKVSNGGDPDNEKFAGVELPLRLDGPTVAPQQPAAAR